MHAPHRRAAALLLTLVLLATGCSKKDDHSSSTTSTTTHAGSSSKSAGGKVTKRKVLGTASVHVGTKAWTFDITTCVSAKDRITAQGDDRKGHTVVATFARSTKLGSLTVSGPDDAWSVGPAGGTKAKVSEISKTSVKGTGPFGHRALAAAPDAKPTRPSKKGAKAGAKQAPTAPKPTKIDRTDDGSFEVTCTAK